MFGFFSSRRRARGAKHKAHKARRALGSFHRLGCENLESRLLLASNVPAGFQEELVAGGLYEPSTMTFAPDGRIFVAEKPFGVRVIKDGALLATPFVTLSVERSGERGVQTILFDPNFAINRYVYVYYTRKEASSPFDRLSRFTASASNPDVATPGSETVILDHITTISPGYHNGGVMKFGADGMMYIAIGDLTVPTNVQNLQTINGKLLRLDVANFDPTKPLDFANYNPATPNPLVPADNPYVGVPNTWPIIYARGLRNPFSGDILPGTNTLFINDVGAGAWEEINVAAPGVNYGWPNAEGNSTNPAFTNPLYTYPHISGSGSAIAGGSFYTNSAFPSQYSGTYFFADYVQSFIRNINPTTGVVTSFATNVEIPTDVDQGPDGSLYWVAHGPGSGTNGAIYRIRYTAAINRPPTAVAAATSPTTGLAPLTVSLSGAGSSDPDGDTLFYSWTFGDGTTATGVTASHTYATDGTYLATLTVNDRPGGTGLSHTSPPVTVTVGNRAPMGVISTSAATYQAGDTILFSGTATDPDDGTLPASAYEWSVVFRHNVHTHPFLDSIPGVTGGDFQIPLTGEADPDQRYRVHLTVTDSGGLQHSSFVDVFPQTSQFTYGANFAGLTVSLDGTPVTSTTTITGVVGMTRTLGAALSQTVNNNTYEFVSWSDGGAATHEITTPASATTFTANYVIVNQGPSAVASATSLTTGMEPLTVNFTGASSSDPDNDALTYTWDFGDGTSDTGVTVSHTFANIGAYQVRLTVNDRGDGSGLASTSPPIVVSAGVNVPPDAVTDVAATTQDTAITIAVLPNDTDLNSDPLTVTSVTQGAHGTVVRNPDNTIRYTPDANYVGSDTFNYSISDGRGGTDSGIVNVAVRGVYYFSTSTAGTVTGSTARVLDFDESDIVQLVVEANGQYEYQLHFDGSDVGLDDVSENVDAFALLPDGSILVSTSGAFSVPGPTSGTILVGGGEDLLRFVPTSIGPNTIGTWAIYFDGSDVGLAGGATENIDSLAQLSDGRLLLSVNGNFTVDGGVFGQDEDLIAFQPTSLGETTAGTWSLYFDGSDVNLATSPNENVVALFVREGAASGSLPKLYLATALNFSVTGVTGQNEDLFAFTPATLGLNTAGTYGPGLTFDGSNYGLDSFALDGIHLGFVAAAPTAVAVATSPTTGVAPLTVSFDGNGITDPNGDSLSYTWSFGDGATETGDTVSHTYTAPGTFLVTLTVHDRPDGTGLSNTSLPIVVTVTSTPPVGTINLPAIDTTYQAGSVIAFAGEATDDEDGTLPASAFQWSIRLHHDIHTHPFLDFPGVTNGSFQIPLTGEFEADQFYRVTLTVTDSSGATHSSFVDILPQTSLFELNANIPGLTLLLDGSPQTLPAFIEGVVGMTRTVSAPATQSFSGQTYQFVSWSDGGTATHNIATPAVETTYTATYVLQPGNSTPVANTDTVTTTQDAAISVNVLANDTDADTDPLIVTSVTPAAHGTAVRNPDNTIRYTPAANYRGSDTFTYAISDGRGGTATGTVNVSVRGVYFLSTDIAGTLTGTTGGSVGFAQSDILQLAIEANGQYQYQLHFDGSDVGLTTAAENVDAFALLPDGSLLLSTTGAFSVPGPGSTSIVGSGEDLLRFVPTSLGDNTAGTWSFYFDGSDVGLSATAENIDGVFLLSDGRLLISVSGEFSVPGGIKGKDEDLFAFQPSTLGDVTAGTWSLYFDGSDVNLATSPDENVVAFFVREGATSGTLPKLYLSTILPFKVTGLSGQNEDVFAFTPSGLGANTSGTFGTGLTLDGSLYGLTAFSLDGIHLGPAPTSGGTLSALAASPAPASETTALLSATYSSTAPATITAGKSVTYSITLTNTGSETWNSSGTNRVRLAVAFASASDSASAWASEANRFKLPRNVAPGRSITFKVTTTAPKTPGNYVLHQALVTDGDFWFPESHASNVVAVQR